MTNYRLRYSYKVHNQGDIINSTYYFALKYEDDPTAISKANDYLDFLYRIGKVVQKYELHKVESPKDKTTIIKT